MNKPLSTLLTTLAAAAMLFTAGAANADRWNHRDRDYRPSHEWRDHDRHAGNGHRHWREERRHWKKQRRHWKKHRRHHYRSYSRWGHRHRAPVVRERIVIRERPVYRDYGYSAPGVTIGFSIPPIIIPFR